MDSCRWNMYQIKKIASIADRLIHFMFKWLSHLSFFQFNLWFSTPAFPSLSMNYQLTHLFIKYNASIDLPTLVNKFKSVSCVINARPIKWNELQSNVSFDVMIEMCLNSYFFLENRNDTCTFMNLKERRVISMKLFELRPINTTIEIN